MNVSLDGLERAEALLDRSAERIARSAVATSDEDTVSLSDEMVALMQARTSFQANVKTVQAADEMNKSLLLLFG
ncbi:MAG: flagellar basal body rod C-terminal domain-containing protein [Bryobacteraceae bacterium]